MKSPALKQLVHPETRERQETYEYGVISARDVKTQPGGNSPRKYRAKLNDSSD